MTRFDLASWPLMLAPFPHEVIDRLVAEGSLSLDASDEQAVELLEERGVRGGYQRRVMDSFRISRYQHQTGLPF
jgi:hypothetical protein